MARKPLEQLSPAYRRRIERAMAKGKTLQQARGHKAQEHVIRKQREIEKRGLSGSQERTVFLWAAKRLFEVKDHEAEPEHVLEYARVAGYEWFVNYRKIWDAARRQYKREIRNGSWASRGMGYLTELANRSSAPDVSWLYYH